MKGIAPLFPRIATGTFGTYTADDGASLFDLYAALAPQVPKDYAPDASPLARETSWRVEYATAMIRSRSTGASLVAQNEAQRALLVEQDDIIKRLRTALSNLEQAARSFRNAVKYNKALEPKETHLEAMEKVAGDLLRPIATEEQQEGEAA